MFQEQGLVIHQRKGEGNHSLLSFSGVFVVLLYTYIKTIPKVSSHNSFQKLLNNRCHYCYPPSQEDILIRSPTYERELLPPSFSQTVPRRHTPQSTTYGIAQYATVPRVPSKYLMSPVDYILDGSYSVV